MKKILIFSFSILGTYLSYKFAIYLEANHPIIASILGGGERIPVISGRYDNSGFFPFGSAVIGYISFGILTTYAFPDKEKKKRNRNQ